MNSLDALNAAFDGLNAARRADTGTSQDAYVIWGHAEKVKDAADSLFEERRDKEIYTRRLPNLQPLPPVMSAQDLARKVFGMPREEQKP